jgi:hypothetical protein
VNPNPPVSRFIASRVVSAVSISARSVPTFRIISKIQYEFPLPLPSHDDRPALQEGTLSPTEKLFPFDNGMACRGVRFLSLALCLTVSTGT